MVEKLLVNTRSLRFNGITQLMDKIDGNDSRKTAGRLRSQLMIHESSKMWHVSNFCFASGIGKK